MGGKTLGHFDPFVWSVKILFRSFDTSYCVYLPFCIYIYNCSPQCQPMQTSTYFLCSCIEGRGLTRRLNSAWYQHANTVPLPSCHAVREFTVSSYRCYPCSLSLAWEWGGDGRQGEHRRWQPHKTQSPFLTMGTFLNCREHGEEFKHFHLVIIISKNRHEKENPSFFLFVYKLWNTDTVLTILMLFFRLEFGLMICHFLKQGIITIIIMIILH